MTFLVSNPDNHTDGGTLELDGADSITSADVGGFTYVFVAGGVDDGVSVFRLLANGTMTPVADVTDNATLKLDGATGLSTAMVDGNTYLFVAGTADSGVSVFRVGTDGSLTNAANAADDATMFLSGVTDTATARVGTSTYLFTAGTADDGISIFRVAGNGALTNVGNVADTGTLKLDGVDALTTVTVGGASFLIAAGGVDDGVSVFSIAANGTLTNTNNFSDNATLNLNGASDVTTAVIGGVTYLFVAGAADSGISVFSLNSSGILTSVFNFTDTAATLIGAVSSLSVTTIGTSTYLLAGGNENGLSMFRVENGSNSGVAAGTLTFIDNIADSGSRELSGVVTTASASIGGSTYFLGAGATDDGVSSFHTSATGQFYFFGQGDQTDTRLAFINNDGGNQTAFVDNNPSADLITTTPQELGVDTAAGFYFALINGGNLGESARLVRGSLGGGAVTTLFTYPGPDGVLGSANDDDTIVNAMQIDVINHKIYVGEFFFDASSPTLSGIRQYTYNPVTGVTTDDGFLVTFGSSNKPQENGFDVLDVSDFAIDAATHNLFFTESAAGGGGVEGLWRLNTATPNVITQVVSQAQFPDTHTNGFFIDVEVDRSTGLLYFDTESQAPFGNAGYNAAQNAIYWISETATGGTATLLVLSGLPVGGHFYPGDMQFDQATRQLYVSSEETDDGSGADTDDVIYVFQLSLDGHSASLINTISLIPAVTNIAANIGGMTFNDIPALTGISGTGTHAGEQGAAITLLTATPTITDVDGDHLSSATVQITQGLFSSNESNATDDHLQVTAAALSGTNITATYNAATGTLTLSGYDTLAHYQQALAGVQYFTTGDNPTNFGLDTTRTFTWTVSDGALGVPGGSQNSATTSITLDAVNDGPTNNNVPASLTTPEDTPKAITGLSISDPDANPAITNVTVTLTVLHGTLTLLTNVTAGLTAGQIAGNGSNTVTITAPLNDINATLASATGLTYTNIADYNGSDTLHIVTNDGGNTGSGGALGDTDDIAITITPVVDIANDTVNVAEDSGANSLNAGGNNLLGNDTFENPGRTITLAGPASHGTVTINDNGNGPGSDDFVVYTPNANYNGSDSFTYTVTSPAGIFETATVTVNVAAVNDPVTATAPTSGSVNEDISAPITGMSISDIDTALAPAGVYQVTLSALHGTLTLTTLTGLSFDAGDGTTDASMTFHGTLANINNALATASYLSNSNYNGSETITLNVTDTFVGVTATGSGAPTSDSKSYLFTVNPINDPPVNTVPGPQTINEDATKTFTTISVADVDAGTLTVTLTVAHGTLTLSGTTGLVFGPGDGTADATMTFTGTTTDINNALNGLVYAPNADFNGSDSLQIVTNDKGLTGPPGPLQDSDSVTINITAINDAPVVVNGATVSIPATNEDTPGTGATFDSLLATHYSDAADNQIPNGGASSPGAFTGVAVTANGSSAGTGQWQYLSGVTWINIGTVSDAAAKLFDHNTQIRFNPAPDYNGPAPTLTVHLIDNALGFSITDAQVVNISAPGATGGTTAYSGGTVVLNQNVTAINDAPVNTVPLAQTINEDASRTFSSGNGNAISVADVDAGTLTVTLTVAHGTLTLSGTTGLVFGPGDGTADATMTFTGTTTDINNALNGLVYTPNPDYNGSDTLQIVTNDNGLTGTPGPLQDSDSVTINITAINDTPLVSLAPTLAATEQVVSTIDAAGTVHDADLDALNGGNGNYAGATLTIANNGGNDANDLFALGASGAFTVSGANLQSGGLTFATFTGGNGTPLVVTFTSSSTTATTALVNAVLDALQYTYTGDNPPAAIDAIVSLNDGAPANAGQGSTAGHPATGSDIIHITIVDTPENQPPVVDLNTGTAGIDDTNIFSEGSSGSGLGTAIAVTDPENDMITGARITLTDPAAGDLLFANLPLPPGITVDTVNSTSSLLILTGTATAANYASALDQLSFTNNSDDPTIGGTDTSRTITVTVNDGTHDSAPATMTISVLGTNDEPTLTATGQTSTLTEGGAAIDLFSAVTASTIEANQTLTSLTLTVSNVTDGASETLSFDGSTVALTNGNSVTTAGHSLAVTVTVVGTTATVSFAGASLSAATLQTVVDGLAYGNSSENPTDADRVVTITQLVDSGSNSAPNDNVADLSIASTVTVHSINDAPINVVPGAQSINEDGSFTLSSGGGNAISVSDADATMLTVTLAVGHGTLTLASTAGLSFSGGSDGTADATMIVTGTAAAINAALGSGLTYNPTPDYHGGDSLSVSTTDNGQTGNGGAQTDLDTVAITIASVNDAPSGADHTVVGSEDDPYVFTASDFGFTDPADGNAFNAVSIITFPGQGKLFLDLDGPGGSAPVDLSTVGSGVFVGIADINAGHLYFQPDPDEYGNGYANFTFKVQDDGGIANGGVDLDPIANTITIDVAPDNLPPVVDLDSGTAGVNYTTAFTEDGAAVAIGSGVAVSDPDAGLGDMIESATITLTDRVTGDSLTLGGVLPPGFTAVTTPSAGAITIQITGTGTGAQYQALIQSILYATTSQDPTVGGADPDRTITVTVNDGTIDSAAATTTVHITAVDDAPTGQPDQFTITESGTITGGNLFASNGSGPDTDPDGPPLTISAVNGSGANVNTQITLASGALLTVHSNGTFDYNPNGAFDPTPTAGSGAVNTPGHDHFDYTLAGGSGPVSVDITLTGLDTDDTLRGTAGPDILMGGNGNDTYYIENTNDQVIELAAGGAADRIITSVDYTLGGNSYVETLEAAAGTAPLFLMGNSFDNTIIGNAGANILHGGGGTGDVLIGLGGNDAYYTDVASTQIVEVAGGGADTLYTSVSYQLGGNADVETLSTNDYSATTAINLTGNYLDNTIVGNAGTNILQGSGGTDMLYGLNGNDTYYVDVAATKVFENSGGGTDAVYVSVSYALLAGQEIETLSTNNYSATTAINLQGNGFGQTLVGNDGANILSGGGGTDNLYGLGGNDTYYVDVSSTHVFENAGGGNDTVYASVNYTLGAGQEIELLSANSFSATSALVLIGNDIANSIFGNAGANTLDGKGGNDVLVGFDGADTFAFSTTLGAGNVDVVFGFEHNIDTIGLDHNIFAAAGGLGTLNANAFFTGAAAHDADDRIIYNSATGQLFYDADGNGAGVAIQFATLSPGLGLTATDFHVI